MRALADHLRREIDGEVLFDPFDRGRYATDASFYQIEPIGVVLPKRDQDLAAALAIAAEHGVPVLPRGAGTSQGGQTIGRALVIDTSKYLTKVLELDPPGRRAVVEPGLVLDRLNARLRPHGLFFPVDVATSSQATIGGMAGNNSAGARSIRYGLMVDNVRGVEARLAGGELVRFGRGRPVVGGTREASLAAQAQAVYAREAGELAARIPKVTRHVAGYNLARLSTARDDLTPLLIGSEGTLAFFTRIELDLQSLPAHRVLGVCQFPTLRTALDATRHIVPLGPSAVELVDRTLLDLARRTPQFAEQAAAFVVGQPDAVLLVEFSGDDRPALERDLDRLRWLVGDLGFDPARSFVNAASEELQREIWAVRRASLNIVMSMRGDRKPVSFIEDCAVPLEDLGEYVDRLTEIFARHGTQGTFYAHASVGCLHVRPILNLKLERDVKAMRAIAEEAHALVRAFKGSHSGEHGDGLVRSEFLEPMLGSRLVRAFEEIKQIFDPRGLMNPGKIVRPPRMDDRALFRYPPGYRTEPVHTVLDWSAWGGLAGAVEMCNNNGACRTFDAGVMCPSYRVTMDEEHTTRGRANALRLALSGQLGPDAFTSSAMRDAMELCVGCKACRRECPTGVDMARMKIEFLQHYVRAHGLRLSDRLIAYLPRYAPWASRLAWLVNRAGRSRAARRLAGRLLGLAPARPLPEWRRLGSDRELSGCSRPDPGGPPRAREVVLFADTFSTYFEPDHARAAARVLERTGYRVLLPATRGRPLCCGRTFLTVGLTGEAKVEAERLAAALGPYAFRGVPIVGLEPSCLLTLRDELPALLPGEASRAIAAAAVMLEELLDRDARAGRTTLAPRPLPWTRALVQGHCHQKAFGILPALERTLRLIPRLDVATIETTCCGMAGSFGYRHYEISMQMAELSLLPAVREAGPDTVIVAAGTSCRRQIADGAGRTAVHPVVLLDQALAGGQ